MKTKEHKEFEEVYEVISSPPGWVQSYGIGAFGFFLVVGLLICSLIRYPDDIEARVKLISKTPAIRVYSLTRGELSRLFVSEDQQVNEGERLALIKNSADLDDVLLIDSLIRSLDLFNVKRYDFLQLQLKLGDLQTTYSSFLDKLNEFVSFNNSLNYDIRIQLLQNQLADLKILRQSMERRKQIFSKQLAIAHKDMERNNKLYADNAISEVDLEMVNKEFLSVKIEYELLESSIIENQLSSSQISAQLTELKAQYKYSKITKEFELRQSINLLLASIEEWKSVNLINAPISGNIVFTNIRNESEFITENLEVMAIEPENNSDEIVGIALLNGIGLGKIRIGMPVVIHLESYPHYEFGSLRGVVKSIASIPSKEGYLIEVDLINQMVTTYNTEIEFKHEMQGIATIITNDRSVLSKIFERFKSLLEKNKSINV